MELEPSSATLPWTPSVEVARHGPASLAEVLTLPPEAVARPPERTGVAKACMMVSGVFRLYNQQNPTPLMISV